MRIVLRADASKNYGSGHVMRSLAILEEFKNRGSEIVYVGKIDRMPWLSAKIDDFGFNLIVEDESKFQIDAVSDVLLLDSYSINPSSEFISKIKWKRIIVIIDELTPDYDGDLFIHPGLEISWNKHLNRRVLFGANYIPLRKEIKKVAPHNSKLQILIVAGSTNPEYMVEEISSIIALSKNDFEAKCFNSEVEVSNLDSRFVNLPIGEELDFHAQSADLVFTTASTTGLEMIAREIACGMACAFDNQEQYYKIITQQYLAKPIGSLDGNKWSLDSNAIIELVDSKFLREQLIENCKGFIDLNGAKRIVDEILKL